MRFTPVGIFTWRPASSVSARDFDAASCDPSAARAIRVCAEAPSSRKTKSAIHGRGSVARALATFGFAEWMAGQRDFNFIDRVAPGSSTQALESMCCCNSKVKSKKTQAQACATKKKPHEKMGRKAAFFLAKSAGNSGLEGCPDLRRIADHSGGTVA